MALETGNYLLFTFYFLLRISSCESKKQYLQTLFFWGMGSSVKLTLVLAGHFIYQQSSHQNLG